MKQDNELKRIDRPDAPLARRDKEDFKRELAQLINHHSRENNSNTPDFLLATYLEGCLCNYERTVRGRDRWNAENNSATKGADK